MRTETRTTLHTLLDANQRFALLNRGSTNHCPMALCALADMGASTVRLQDFFDFWSQRYALPAVAANRVIERKAWSEAIGQHEAFNPLQHCFVDWIACDGSTAVLVQVLPRVVEVPASVAFHALIRLGHGLAVNNGFEIAAGLAAFVTNPLSLLPAPGTALADASALGPTTKRVAEELELLTSACRDIMVTGDWISDRLLQVAQHPDFVHAFRPFSASPQRIDELAESAIRLFWRTENFTALHMVTAVHAARRVCAVLPAAQASILVAELWRAFCVAYITVVAHGGNGGWPFPERSNLRSSASDWQPLLRAAVASNDDHVIKLVQACWHESKRALAMPTPADSASLYYLAAARAGAISKETK